MILAKTYKSAVEEYLRRTSYLWRCWFIKREYPKLVEGRVLDIGCNIGILSLFTHSSVYVGVDLTRWCVKQASSLNKGAHFIWGDAVTLPIKDCSFDTVIVSELIEYLSEFEKFFSEVKRVLHNDGHLILVAYNAHSTYPLFRKIKKYPERRFYSPSQISMVLRKHGFKLEEYRGLHMFDIMLNFIKIILRMSLPQILRFEEKARYVRLNFSKIAHVTRTLASKHVYVARK